MEQAVNRFYEEVTGRETIELHSIHEYMAHSQYMLGDFKKSLHYTNVLINAQPHHPLANENKIQLTLKQNQSSVSGEGLSPDFSEREISQKPYYDALCRHEYSE